MSIALSSQETDWKEHQTGDSYVLAKSARDMVGIRERHRQPVGIRSRDRAFVTFLSARLFRALSASGRKETRQGWELRQ